MNSKFQESFDKTRIAGSIAAGALDEVQKIIKPGVTTEKIDKLCYQYINDHGAYSAPLFYRGYPKSCCISANHIVCHGIPSQKILEEGDIVNVDVTAFKDGWHGDTSRMFSVGKVSVKSKNLIDTTLKSLNEAIKILKDGICFGDIGYVIQTIVEANGFSVVRDFCGHGIGKKFHESPQILHYGKKNTGIRLEEGMIFTIEPMINVGSYKTKLLNDGWTVVTQDHELSAQYEHTVLVTNKGSEILTIRTEEDESEFK